MRSSTAPRMLREGTAGESSREAGREGVSKPRGGNAPPEVPVMDEECGNNPEFRWNHGQYLFALSQNGSGRFSF